jgi:hypothetical protein
MLPVAATFLPAVSLARARCSVSGGQIPSERDAPRHSPPEPEHLPPRSLTPSSRREPPHPAWFGHQPRCFRHIRHAVRCALGRRIQWLQSHRHDVRVPLFGFCQFNVPRAHHEHPRTPTSATGQLPASDDHFAHARRAAFPLLRARLRPAGSPVARGDCIVFRTVWTVHRTARGTVALTPTWTTARPGGFSPAGGSPDT